MKIERSLSFRRMKRQKKYSLLILSIAILACMLLQVTFQLSYGLQNTFVEYRKEIYGEWDRILLSVDEQSEMIINDNPFLAKKGTVEIYGVLAGDYIDNKQSNIGTMDDTAWKLGRLKMREGRLPESETEIALEYSMAASLGYEDMLGETITLDILSTTEFSHDQSSKEYQYTLCGFIKDYQLNWEVSTRHRLPTGIVTKEGAQRIGNSLEKHIFVNAAEGKESVYKDLEKSGELGCEIGENTHQGNMVTVQIPYENFLESIRFLTIGAAISILYIAVSHSIGTRNEFWTFLHSLGMEKKRMYEMVFWEAFFYTIASIIIGTFGGLVFYQMALPGFESITGQKISRQMFFEPMITAILCSILIIAISYILSSIRLFQILMKTSKRQKIRRRKKGDNLTQFTPLAVAWHHIKHAPVRKFLQIMLLASSVVIIGLGIYKIQEQAWNLEIFEQSTGNGYYLDTETTPDSPGIPKSLTVALSQIEGVEKVEAYDRNCAYETDFTVDMSDYSNSQYVQKVLESQQYFTNTVTMENISLSILSTERWEDMERFVKNLSEGTVTFEDFENGDFCILMLPPLEKTEESYYLGNIVAENYQEEFITEDTIKTGDMLKITYHLNTKKMVEKEVPVTAILRTSSQADLHSPLPGGSGISIITGTGFWEEFGIEAAKDYDQIVRVLVGVEANVLDTQEHILRILRKYPTVTMKNYHEEYEQRQAELYTFTGMYVLFAVFYLILVSVVLGQIHAAESFEKERETAIFRALGMETTFIRKIRRAESLMIIGLAGGVGTILLILFIM